ncbi:hypothetical protein Hdeb2414_s0014g00435551 [Helianthus debilis subsp. tardiflorus]
MFLGLFVRSVVPSNIFWSFIILMSMAPSGIMTEEGIKVIDTSVESFATGAWQALGNAWKGCSRFVQKASTAKGIEVLEYVGKETVDLLITKSGVEVDKNVGEGGNGTEVDQLMEEVTFDRCFYIYGGPEQLELRRTPQFIWDN